MTMIQIKHLNFDYPTARALHEVNLNIPAGAVVALVGPNGAGKSTLMRVIAGLDEPTSGSVRVAGVDVLKSPREAHKTMGYLSDFFGLYDTLTVAQCLRHAASLRGVADDELEIAVQRAAAGLNLTQRLQSVAGELSRGLKQRLAIAQAIIHQPKLLLLDEPASGLDPDARASLSALFVNLKNSGMTLLVSSHILSELEEYCTHMLVIQDGRVKALQALESAAPQADALPAQAGMRLYKVQLSQPHEPLATILEKLGLQAQHHSPTQLTLQIANDAPSAAQTLQALIKLGVPVADFAPVQASLAQVYKQSISAH